MIAFIRGRLYKKTENSVIIDHAGIGYQVFVSAKTLSQLGDVDSEVLLHTYMKVSDDGVSLFGFLLEEELKMFHLLLGVSGIGPKNAVGILSHLPPDAVVMAVMTEDAAALAKAPGIGKKTAQRVILELKDKFKAEDMLPKGISPQQTFEMSGEAVNEAIDALMVLGYSQSESTRAVMAVSADGLNGSQLIKLALKRLATL